MRLVPTAVAVLILLSGCADTPPAAADVGDCKEGASEFFLVLVGNNDCECDRYDTKFTVVERNGDVFQYVGQTANGTGLVEPEEDSMTNVSADVVLRYLKAAEKWTADQDFQVERAWFARIPIPEFQTMCRVILEEGDPDFSKNKEYLSCLDGGWFDLYVSSAAGVWDRRVGCLPRASQAEDESSKRILTAINDAFEAARATIGLVA